MSRGTQRADQRLVQGITGALLSHFARARAIVVAAGFFYRSGSGVPAMTRHHRMTTGGQTGEVGQTGSGLPGLRAAREAKLLTQGELAEQSGVDASTISDLEKGKRSARFRAIRQLAATLGVAPQELMAVPPRRPSRRRQVRAEV
jgi:DNA-binding XRE family transcriptional regulator